MGKLTTHYLPSQALDRSGTLGGRPCTVLAMTFSYRFGVTFQVHMHDDGSHVFVTPSKGDERPALDLG